MNHQLTLQVAEIEELRVHLRRAYMRMEKLRQGALDITQQVWNATQDIYDLQARLYAVERLVNMHSAPQPQIYRSAFARVGSAQGADPPGLLPLHREQTHDYHQHAPTSARVLFEPLPPRPPLVSQTMGSSPQEIGLKNLAEAVERASLV